jgi:hypothetical protein
MGRLRSSGLLGLAFWCPKTSVEVHGYRVRYVPDLRLADDLIQRSAV